MRTIAVHTSKPLAASLHNEMSTTLNANLCGKESNRKQLSTLQSNTTQSQKSQQGTQQSQQGTQQSQQNGIEQSQQGTQKSQQGTQKSQQAGEGGNAMAAEGCHGGKSSGKRFSENNKNHLSQRADSCSETPTN